METFPFSWVILINESVDAHVFTEVWLSLQLLLGLRSVRLVHQVDAASIMLSLPERFLFLLHLKPSLVNFSFI